MNLLNTSTAEMYVDDDGILRLKLLNGSVITLENLKETYTVFKQLLGNKQVLLLLDARVKYKFSKAAREFAASKNANLNRVATAYLINSFVGRVMANFYIRFNKPAVPTKIFTTEEAALIWLKSFYILPGEPYKKPAKR